MLELWSYLFEKSEKAADRIVDTISAKCDLLCEFPLMGRARPEFGQDYRSIVVENYVIFYRVKPTELEVSRVLHSARDITEIMAPEGER